MIKNKHELLLTRKTLNQAGFSLIELLVVLVIVLTLSYISYTNYSSFKTRALQKQGFTLLNSYYMSAQNTHAEFGLYPGNYVQTGFQPFGNIKYNLRAEDGTDIPGINDDSCVAIFRPCNCGGACPTFRTWTDTHSSHVSVLGHGIVSPHFDAPCGAVGALGTTDDTFSIRISGRIKPYGRLDVYGMNEQKMLGMCQDGL